MQHRAEASDERRERGPERAGRLPADVSDDVVGVGVLDPAPVRPGAEEQRQAVALLLPVHLVRLRHHAAPLGVPRPPVHARVRHGHARAVGAVAGHERGARRAGAEGAAADVEEGLVVDHHRAHPAPLHAAVLEHHLPARPAPT